MLLEKLETDEPKKLLLEYSIPAIVGSMVVALYNLIDSIYIGNGPNLGDHAIGGLGIVLPIMTLLTAIGALVGTGAASRVSIFLGIGDKKTAEQILANATLLSILLTGSLVLIIYLFIEPILFMIGATKESYSFAHEFLIYYLPCNIVLNLNYALCGIMRASGYPRNAMYIMLAGVITNLALAPIFIFMLKWGMKGAAVATSISTVVSLLPVLWHFGNAKNTLSFCDKKISFNIKIIWSIVSIGLSPFIIQLAGSIIVFFVNNRLRIYGGSLAIEAYTIANRLALIIILVIVGLTQGMQPIVGYNYGAKRLDRVYNTVNLSAKIGIGIGILGLIIALFFTDLIIKPFNPSFQLADEASNALRIVTLMLPLSSLQIVISSFFQSVGMPLKATALSLSRQFLFLLPCLFLLPTFWGLTGVWASIPISDFISSILAIALYRWQIRLLKIEN